MVTRASVDRDCASGLVSSLVISLVVKLTFSLRRPATEAYELHRCLLLGAWRADGSVPVRLGGTPGVLHPDRSMPSIGGPVDPGPLLDRAGEHRRLVFEVWAEFEHDIVAATTTPAGIAEPGSSTTPG